MIGMTSASFATGNTVILKPASTAPAIAYQFIRILEDIGLPAGVVNFLTGSGSVIGDTLVDHPQLRFIAFTGSREVGLRIYERASKHQKGQRWLKRSLLEMGGKDAVVVTKRPIWMQRPVALSFLRSVSRDRSVRPVRAPSSSLRSTIRSCIKSLSRQNT